MRIHTKKLHIVILDFDDIRNPLLSAGQAWATHEVGKRFIQKGHSVTVISSRYPGYKDRKENGISYTHIGLGSSNIRLNNIVYIFSVPFAVKKINADIIIECFTAPVSTLFSPLFTKIPVVAIPSSFEADRFSNLYHLPFHIVERIGSRFYTYFLPYTKYLDEKFRKLNPHIISEIVPEGVSDEYFEISGKKRAYILFLGRFDVAQKGIDLLLRSYAKVADTISLPLVIAGQGPDEKKIKTLITELHLESKVKIIGACYGEKKKKVMAEALFVAQPSRSEGFSLFALEALAAGLPLVCFDIPGLSWVSGNASLKAKPYDTDEYAQLLLKATDHQINSFLSSHARNFARRYSWNTVTDDYLIFFTRILEKKKKNKRIRLVFSNYDDTKNPYYGGGGAKAIHEVAKRLSHTYDVTVLTGNYPRAVNEITDNVKYVRVGHAYLGAKLGQLVFQFLLPFYVRKLSFDVWLESFTPPFSTAFLQLFTSKKVIGLVHFLSGEEMLRKYKIPFLLIEYAGLKTYKYFITVTQILKDKLRNANKHASITVIPNGIDTSFLRRKTKRIGKYIFFIGRIEVEQKGLDILLRVYQKIHMKISYSLIIAGSGLRTEEEKLQNLITSYHLEKHVKWIGRVEGAKKETLYRNASIVVLPSRYESQSLSVLESMSFGLPVIIFSIAGASWVPNKCCFKVTPFDEGKLEKTIVTVIKDKRLREKKARKAYTFAKKFNWELIAHQYDQYIQQVLDRD